MKDQAEVGTEQEQESITTRATFPDLQAFMQQRGPYVSIISVTFPFFALHVDGIF